MTINTSFDFTSKESIPNTAAHHEVSNLCLAWGRCIRLDIDWLLMMLAVNVDYPGSPQQAVMHVCILWSDFLNMLDQAPHLLEQISKFKFTSSAERT